MTILWPYTTSPNKPKFVNYNFGIGNVISGLMSTWVLRNALRISFPLSGQSGFSDTYCWAMESSAHGCALVRDQVFDDKNAVPYTQSISESQGIMAWDSASYNEDTEDEELVRKRKQLQLIEAQIASKKASIALKKGKLQQGPLCYDSDDENEPADPTGIRDTQVGTEKDSEKCSLFTNNISQKPAHQEAISLTERQISILNELTQPFLSLKVSRPSDHITLVRTCYSNLTSLN